MSGQPNRIWRTAFWILFAGWVLGAALFMARMRGGFFTNYLSDVAFPPWFYIYVRGLSAIENRPPRLAVAGDWFGRSPERAMLSILAVGIVSEVKTLYWPTGVVSGTFDPLDIAAYAVGLIVCYYFDKKTIRPTKRPNPWRQQR